MRALTAAVAIFLLAGCDPGRKDFKIVEEQFNKNMAADPFGSEEAATQLMATYIAAKAVADVHSEKKSGKDAKALIGKMEAEYLKALAAKKAEITESSAEVDAQGIEVKKITDKIVKDLKKKRTRDMFAPFPFKKGDCVIPTLSDEFKNRESYLDVSIFRIETLGEDKVLLRALFKAEASSSIPVLKQVAQSMEPQEDYKMYVENYMKISCATADELGREFDVLVTKIDRMSKSLIPLSIVGRALGRDLRIDIASGEKVPKDVWVKRFSDGVVPLLCDAKQFLRSCHKINQEECAAALGKVLSACVGKVRDALPETLTLPADGLEWAGVIMKCVSPAIENEFLSKKIDSAYCRDPKNFGNN